MSPRARSGKRFEIPLLTRKLGREISDVDRSERRETARFGTRS